MYRRLIVSVALMAVALMASAASGPIQPGPPSPSSQRTTGATLQCLGSGDPTFSRFYDHLNILLWRFYDTNQVLEPWDLKGHFTSEPGYTYDLPGTTDMVLMLWSVGELERRTTPKGRAAWAHLINSFQDDRTGLFIRGNRRRMPVADLTARASIALKLLGATPRYPFAWARSRFGTQEDVRHWVEQIRESANGDGSREFGLGAALATFPVSSIPKQWPVWLLGALEGTTDPNTGLWNPSLMSRVLGAPTAGDIESTAPIWWFLETMAEPIPSPDKVVDAILDAQASSGVWGAWVVGETPPGFADLAALNGLRYAFTHLDANERQRLKPRVLDALDRSACAAVRYLSVPDTLKTEYTDTRVLTSAVLAAAELDALYFEVTGQHRFSLSRPWRPALPYLAWM